MHYKMYFYNLASLRISAKMISREQALELTQRYKLFFSVLQLFD